MSFFKRLWRCEALESPGGEQSFGNPESKRGSAPARNPQHCDCRAVLKVAARPQAPVLPEHPLVPGAAEQSPAGQGSYEACGLVQRVLSQSFVKPKHTSLQIQSPKKASCYARGRTKAGQKAGGGYSARPERDLQTSFNVSKKSLLKNQNQNICFKQTLSPVLHNVHVWVMHILKSSWGRNTAGSWGHRKHHKFTERRYPLPKTHPEHTVPHPSPEGPKFY